MEPVEPRTMIRPVRLVEFGPSYGILGLLPSQVQLHVVSYNAGSLSQVSRPARTEAAALGFKQPCRAALLAAQLHEDEVHIAGIMLQPAEPNQTLSAHHVIDQHCLYVSNPFG